MTSETEGIPPGGTELTALARDGSLAGRWLLDPAASTAEFRVRHFWNTITVRGSFGQLEGEATVGPDGTVTGRLVIDAALLNTKNKQRDKHLRSADFFDVAKHPHLVLTVRQAALSGSNQLAGEATLAVAGTDEPVSLTAQITQASPDAVTLQAELTVDRSRFGMTWSPLRVAAMQATGSVTARFTRAAPEHQE
jgi:polyisoprenoid-binding protein YceI